VRLVLKAEEEALISLWQLRRNGWNRGWSARDPLAKTTSAPAAGQPLITSCPSVSHTLNGARSLCGLALKFVAAQTLGPPLPARHSLFP
jgi:hypothetical protein